MTGGKAGRREGGKRGLVLVFLIAALGGTARAQQTDSARTTRQADAQAQLTARGLPAELAGQVAVVARETESRGLPGQAVVDKAIEGWFKRVPPPRIRGRGA